MFTVAIPTASLARHIDNHDQPAGPALAALLREVADLVARDYQILPWPGGDAEWITERRAVILHPGATAPSVSATLTLAHD